jgi:uncharacterized protein (TIGR02757 family)
MIDKKLIDFLNKKVDEYDQPFFIKDDPVSVPHRFTVKQDIEISAFFASIFAWGNRVTIINKSLELMNMMDNSPHDFCLNHSEKDLRRFLSFRHRTFNPTDLLYFIAFFKIHYNRNSSLENAFSKFISKKDPTTENALNGFYEYFFSLDDIPYRTRKHVACPVKNSTCKRLNMFLRWMVRKDNNGVDFGIWKKISPSQLVIPIDLHVARVARNFGLLDRKQTDWQAALELTSTLKVLDPSDPVKYDFALFGLGVLEKY